MPELVETPVAERDVNNNRDASNSVTPIIARMPGQRL